MKGWETVCAAADEDEVRRWASYQRNCTNAGLLCGDLVGVDIDVLDEGHAHHLTALATDMLCYTRPKNWPRSEAVARVQGRDNIRQGPDSRVSHA